MPTCPLPDFSVVERIVNDGNFPIIIFVCFPLLAAGGESNRVLSPFCSASLARGRL